MSAANEVYRQRPWSCRVLLDRRFFKEVEFLSNQPSSQFKSAVLRTSPSVVGIVSHGVPTDMVIPSKLAMKSLAYEARVFTGSGTIIECEKASDGKFSTTIITTSNLFMRTNGVKPSDIEVDVLIPNGKLYQGHVLACDFHYNLALVNAQLDTPMQPVNLRDIDDIISIDERQFDESPSFKLRHHLDKIKIRPGDMVASLNRSSILDIDVVIGPFSSEYPGLDCKELCSFDCENGKTDEFRGGPVISCRGEVIGITSVENYFLPSNIVSRWWNYYKQFKKLCRPWLGVNVANLHAANFQFLEPFVRNFPTVKSGVIVTEVVKNSAAGCSGLCRGDVIVQCNGAIVGSILDFFDKLWDKLGKSVELSLLRDAGHVNLTLIIGEPTYDTFYRWPIPICESRDSDSEMSEARPPVSNNYYLD